MHQCFRFVVLISLQLGIRCSLVWVEGERARNERMLDDTKGKRDFNSGGWYVVI